MHINKNKSWKTRLNFMQIYVICDKTLNARCKINKNSLAIYLCASILFIVNRIFILIYADDMNFSCKQFLVQGCHVKSTDGTPTGQARTVLAN
jgi:hypothetical protein